MKISIIGAFYNVSEYVDRAVTSLLKQSFRDWELIAIDDFSQDDTYSKLVKASIHDYRIKTLRMHTNSGLSTVRNYGMDLAQGEYIMFLDGDDYFPDPLFFQNLLSFVERGQYDWVNFNFVLEYSNGKRKVRTVSADVTGMYSSVWNKIYKKSVLKNLKFPVDKKFEDVSFSLEAYQKSGRRGTFSNIGYIYWQRKNSIVRQKKYDKGHADVPDILFQSIKSKKFLINDEVIEYLVNQLFNHYIVMIGDNFLNVNLINNRYLNSFNTAVDLIRDSYNNSFSKNVELKLKFIQKTSKNKINLFEKFFIKIILIGRSIVR